MEQARGFVVVSGSDSGTDSSPSYPNPKTHANPPPDRDLGLFLPQPDDAAPARRGQERQAEGEAAWSERQFQPNPYFPRQSSPLIPNPHLESHGQVQPPPHRDLGRWAAPGPNPGAGAAEVAAEGYLVPRHALMESLQQLQQLPSSQRYHHQHQQQMPPFVTPQLEQQQQLLFQQSTTSPSNEQQLQYELQALPQELVEWLNVMTLEEEQQLVLHTQDDPELILEEECHPTPLSPSKSKMIIQELQDISKGGSVFPNVLMTSLNKNMKAIERAVRSCMKLSPNLFPHLVLLAPYIGHECENMGSSASSHLSQLFPSPTPASSSYSRPSDFQKHQVSRLEKHLIECRQWIDNLDQLVMMEIKRTSEYPLAVFTDAHNFLTAVAAKLKRFHEKIAYVKGRYLADQRQWGDQDYPFLESIRRQVAEE